MPEVRQRPARLASAAGGNRAQRRRHSRGWLGYHQLLVGTELRDAELVATGQAIISCWW